MLCMDRMKGKEKISDLEKRKKAIQEEKEILKWIETEMKKSCVIKEV